MFGTRKRLDALEAAIRTLAQALESQSKSTQESLQQTISNFLSKAVESQATNLDSMAKLYGQMSEIALKRAGQIIGQRGGRATQARKRAKKEMESCPTCRDGSGSSDQILRHFAEKHHEKQLLEQAQQESAPNGRLS